jgi:hypothetical protein
LRHLVEDGERLVHAVWRTARDGTYHLIAVYGGNASFTGSTSAKEILAVASDEVVSLSSGPRL